MKNTPVNVGVVGLGYIGAFHAEYLAAGEIRGARLAAVCDTSAKALQPFSKSAAAFQSSTEMFRSGLVDAVLIAVPQYLHAPIGMDALRCGLHVLMEKPLARHKAEAERLLRARSRRGQVFAIMFNQRTDPRHVWIRDTIAAGRLGPLQRISFVFTEWFRTQAYYASAGWRGTWAGEGGGILMNQYAHHLDLLQWMCGMPAHVRAFCGFGKYHDIEAEDEVTAYLEYSNGATGVFIGSTGEAPGTNRIEIAGDLGRIVLENGRIVFTRNRTSAARFRRTSREWMAKPAVRSTEPAPPAVAAQHKEITRNFVDSIRKRIPLIAPAEDGIRSLELANAMIASSITGKTVSLPLNATAYGRLFAAAASGRRIGDPCGRHSSGGRRPPPPRRGGDKT